MHSFYTDLPVLVTGGAGFIGSHLVERLVQLRARVTVLDTLTTGNLANLASTLNTITFIKDSITNSDVCLKATWGQKVIFHAAALTSVPDSHELPGHYNLVNCQGTANLLEAARINNVESFIFSSSSAVYGTQEARCSELTPCAPTSPYGYSKYIAELYCKEYAQLFKLNTIILRYFNAFGPRQNPQGSYASVVAKFKEQLKHNMPITIFGDGTQTRDFVPVLHIVEANLLMASKAFALRGEVFNIATGKSITLLALVQELKKEFPHYAEKIIFSPERTGDIKHSYADCSKYRTFKSNALERP